MRLLFLFAFLAIVSPVPSLHAQETPQPDNNPARGSLIEDRAARKLVEAGDARFEADEANKAVEVWESVIERYPTSRVRFLAHMRLGRYFLERDRSFEKARVHYELIASEENHDEDQRAEATLKMGVCFYEARNFGKCFQVMRDVIEKFPVSEHVNEAYYYIGLGHFQLGHYSRAIAALEKVGTAMSAEDSQVQKVEAGKRLFVRIEDADLAALDAGQSIKVECKATSGDTEIVECYPVGRNVRIVLGSVTTKLGRPVAANGTLEVKGDDQVTVSYIDQHTADKQFNRQVLHTVTVVGNGFVSITDGAFSETLQGVVLGKSVNVQASDPDRDLSDGADELSAFVEVYRAKTNEELETEAIAAVNAADASQVATSASDEVEEVERFKLVDRVEVRLVEAVVAQPRTTFDDSPAGTNPDATEAGKSVATSVTDTNSGTPPGDTSIHTGVFRATLELVLADTPIAGDQILQALPGDSVRVIYHDQKNSTDGERLVQVEARCIEGNLGGVRVTRSRISDLELRIKTRLKTADALTNIGNRYKEFGLKDNARGKYDQALMLCEEIMTEARQLGGHLLEETYVQLWQIYFEMDRLELAAATAERLQREFPNSGFVDDALLQLAEVARKQGDLNRAIGVYSRLVNMQTSQLRGEAHFGVAECYSAMADAAQGAQATQLYDRAFQEYKKVFDQFPDSGRVGEAVAQMANYYYRQQDYSRAVDTFESVLSTYPDAKFLDVILFNYGRCLYRMDRKAEARRRFDQLIADYPESTLAADAKKISEALAAATP
jgi:TolA-binding protein